MQYISCATVIWKMVDLTLACLILFFSEGLSSLSLFTLTFPNEAEAVMWLEKATGD